LLMLSAALQLTSTCKASQPTNPIQPPAVVLRSPGNEADVVRLPSGQLKLIVTNRFATDFFPILSRTSHDNGQRWGEPKVEF